MSKPLWRLVVFASSLLLALLLAACAPYGTSSTGSQPPGTGTTNGLVNTPDAWATTSGMSSTLPGDIPAYPGAKFFSTSVEDGARTYLYTTPDSIARVLAFYKQQMPTHGWSEQQGNGNEANVLEFTKDPQRVVISAMVPLPTGGSDLTTLSIAVIE
jgi:hypothetical protein